MNSDDNAISVAWKIAFYERLSLADGDIADDTKRESNSISNQRKLLQAYVSSQSDLSNSPCSEYTDDGYSGTNFDRPGVRRLLEDVRNRKINCIIVKDFSRFGRDYIEVGEYLEKIFPFLGVRFIAVNENYDSITSEGRTGGMDVVMKNMVYDFYSKDLSNKVKSGVHVKQLRGTYWPAQAPFGYIKETGIDGRYIIDQDAANVVKRIFALALAGKTPGTIADMLNMEGILTPSIYNRKNAIRGKHNQKLADTSHIWHAGIVSTILNNPKYTGDMVYGKRPNIAPCSKHTRTAKESEWIVIPEAFEAIISKEDFEKVKEMRSMHKASIIRMPQDYLLKGKIACGSCGHMMDYEKRTTIDSYFHCRYGHFSRSLPCGNEIFLEKDLEQIVKQAISSMLLFLQEREVENRRNAARNGNSLKLTDQIRFHQTRIRQLKTERLSVYEQFSAGIISKDVYLSRRAALENQIKEHTEKSNQLEALCREIRNAENSSEKRIIDQALEVSPQSLNLKDIVLTRDLIDMFINKIYIDSGLNIRIIWKFKDVYEDVASIDGLMEESIGKDNIVNISTIKAVEPSEVDDDELVGTEPRPLTHEKIKELVKQNRREERLEYQRRAVKALKEKAAKRVRPDYKRIGKKLQDARNKKGLLQKEVAEIVGTTKIYIGKIERGETRPSLKIILQICGAVELHPAILFAEEEEYLKINEAEIMKTEQDGIDGKTDICGQNDQK